MSNLLNETFKRHLNLLHKHLNENSKLVLEIVFSVPEAIEVFRNYAINNAGNLSADELKKAYRKLSAKHHPDVGGKHEDFIKISAAYEALKNKSSSSSSSYRSQSSTNQQSSTSSSSSNRQSSNRQSSNRQSSNRQSSNRYQEPEYTPEERAEIARKIEMARREMERLERERKKQEQERKEKEERERRKREQERREQEAEFKRDALSGKKGQTWQTIYQQNDKLKQSLDNLLKRK
jgi:curved DNA-binding protein CbpA